MTQSPPTYPSQFNGRILDWTPRFDTRSIDYKVAGRLEVPTPVPEHKNRVRHTWLDQGSEGGCTGFSSTTALSFAPHVEAELTNANAEWAYELAKENDQWPGENYSGSSVLGAMQGLKANGQITGYMWATTVDEIIHAIAFHGPGVFGLNWYANMFHPNSEGILSVSGNLAGGHAICVSAIKDGGDLLRLDNTWGERWGVKGSAWLTAADAARLLGEQAEFAVPTKAHPMPPMGTSGRIDPESGNPGVTGA